MDGKLSTHVFNTGVDYFKVFGVYEACFILFEYSSAGRLDFVPSECPPQLERMSDSMN